MSAPDRSTTASSAYLDLRKLGKDTGRPTDELLQLYALEGFLHRLTLSPHASSLVHKGGVLLAAYTDRRATRDIDLAGRWLQADVGTIRTVVADVTASLHCRLQSLAFGKIIILCNRLSFLIKDL